MNAIIERLCQPRRRRRYQGSRLPTLPCDTGPPCEPNGSQAASSSVEPTAASFNVIDEAIRLLDSETAPWGIQLDVRFDGTVDEQRLRSAVLTALGRHPMARARLKPSPGTLEWEIPAHVDIDPLRVVDCWDECALQAVRARLHSIAIPLAEAPPLRVYLARHHAGDVLMLNANHASMDGFGLLRVLRSIARAYADDDDPTAPVDFLQSRDLPALLAAPTLAIRMRRHLALIEKLSDLILPPARVAGDGGTGRPGYGFHLVRLTPEETTALQGMRHLGTVNDLLLSAFHRAIAQWNVEHGARCRRIGIVVPVNLRPAEWRFDLVGNFSLGTRVTTTRRSRQNRMTTIADVTAQTSRKKKSGIGTALIELLGSWRPLRLSVKQVIVAMFTRLADTAVLSNLGSLDDPPSFGNGVQVSELWFSPPLWMSLGLAIGAVTLSGRLHFSFRYLNRLFGPDAAERFADRYIEELLSLVR